MRYRWAALGLLGGLIFLCVFSHRGGMALWTIGLYFLIYYLLSMSLTRIRAEVGPPTIRTYATPHGILTDIFGTRILSHGSLTMMRLYLTFNRGSRANPMPHTLEGFKLAEESGMHSGRLIVADDVRGSRRDSRLVLGIPPRRIQYRSRQRSWHRRIQTPAKMDITSYGNRRCRRDFYRCRRTLYRFPLVASDSLSILALPSSRLSRRWRKINDR